jgi:predicted Zn-dependent peptidase
LKEVVFGLSFSEEELRKEKEVIFEEIRQIEDDPFRFGNSIALSNLFRDHPYGKPVYGDIKVMQDVTVEGLLDFYKKFFSLRNSSLAVTGEFDMTTALSYIEQIFGDIDNSQPPENEVKPVRKLKKTIEIKKKMDIKKSHLIFAYLAPKYNHVDQISTRILTQVLGAGINPLLGGVLRGRGVERLAEALSMRYIVLKDAGAMVIHLILDEKNIKKIKLKLYRALTQAASYRYSSTDYLPAQQKHIFDYLKSAQSQIKHSAEEFKERGINLAVSYARFLLLNEEMTKEDFITRLTQVTSSRLRKVASKYLSGKKYVMLSLTPGREERKE